MHNIIYLDKDFAALSFTFVEARSRMLGHLRHLVRNLRPLIGHLGALVRYLTGLLGSDSLKGIISFRQLKMVQKFHMVSNKI